MTPAARYANVPEPAALLTQLPTYLRRYWPVWLGTLGAVWLAISLWVWPPTVWLERVQREAAYFADVDRRIDRLTADRSLNNRITKTGRKENVSSLTGYKAGAWLGTRVKIVLSVGLPLALVLLAIGYYLYWYFARKTLLSGVWEGRLAFWLAAFILWFLWHASVLAGLVISPQTAKAGLDSALPNVTIGFWLVQLLCMHIWVRRREDRALAQAAREAELAALTAQVNPPFIFHALQHLTRTAKAEHLPRTTHSLEQLAGIMQYILEESKKQMTDVSREIDFIRDYLRLQELRLPQRDNIQIETSLEWDGKPAPIVPLLLNPLIENAFKYGISIQQTCFVSIQMQITNGLLTFRSENSVLPRTDLEQGTGLGLRNVRKRLQLAYPGAHKLTIDQQADRFRVDLNIKLC